MWPTQLLESAVVIDELALVYVPVPKAGSTSLLWALAALAGVPESAFRHSRKLELTRALTVHDLSVWGERRLLQNRSFEERQEILTGEGWLRFTVVREPVRRIWSSWVGKVLCRDPRFTRMYERQDWFPSVPRTSDDVLESFRSFARAVAATPDEHRDPHWASQASLAGFGAVSYGHVGRVERLGETVAFLGEHGVALPALRRENSVPLPYDPGLLDAPTAAACDRATAPDREAFGYERLTPSADPPSSWHDTVRAALPALCAVIERNERIADLRELAHDAMLISEDRLAS